jgi:uncharacterized membrane protein YhdT
MKRSCNYAAGQPKTWSTDHFPLHPEETALTTPNGGDRSDHSPWNWLLILPIVLPLLTFLYNSDEPRLFGFPLFYWLQFSCIAVGVITTTIVYQMTKRRR